MILLKRPETPEQARQKLRDQYKVWTCVILHESENKLSIKFHYKLDNKIYNNPVDIMCCYNHDDELTSLIKHLQALIMNENVKLVFQQKAKRRNLNN